MLFYDRTYPLTTAEWRRINMRKVAALIGAEMLHNLYNRHWPRINSLRFRHTITNFKNGNVESFAPVEEWDYLQHWLSKKFYSLDPVLLREIKAILNPDYVFIDEIISKVNTTDLSTLANDELGLLLIDIMDFPLGEIYKLNVVQIEYSLNFALHKILSEYEPDAAERNTLLAQLIAPGVLTVSQEIELDFAEIVTKGRELKAENPRDHKQITALITDHHAKYAPAHCAYGEDPPTIESWFERYIMLYPENITLQNRQKIKAHIKEQQSQSKALLNSLNNEKLSVLCPLMAEIGVFRDKNKAKLGYTVIGRLQILNEIARRSQVDREHINYYLMAELMELLDKNIQVPQNIINDRINHGVSFTRMEDVRSPQTILTSTQKEQSSTELTLTGVCASPGQIRGHVKITTSKEDLAKMNQGDIMVAIGTDFDLLEIMSVSAGIITEEGGLLSHASVVSRELQKPCLISVNDATTILHDGDEVLLDASNGKLTLLHKAKGS